MGKNYKLKLSRLKMAGALAVSATSALFAQVATNTFVYTGAAQAFTIPCGANSMTIQAWGAVGGTGNTGGSPGGNGGYAMGIITATPGAVFNIYVGGQGSVTAGGFNGGGAGGQSSSSSGAGGGGATDIRVNGTALSNRIIVAAGGGGGGGNSTYAPSAGIGGGGSPFTSASGVGGGGASGCATGAGGGETGGTAGTYGSGGGGAGYTSGGQGGGQPSAATGGYGCNGTLGNGGAGGGTSFICGGATGGVNGGGGGGGGYYGGGGGMTGTGGCNGGGGGGSSWMQTPLFTSPTYSQGLSTSNGSVIITYNFNSTAVGVTPALPAVCLGNSVNMTGTGSNSYTWAANGNFAGSNATVVSVSPSVNTVYTVSGTNPLGCVSTATVMVYVTSAAPVLTVSASSSSICLGRTVSINASGAVNYNFSGGISNGITFTPQVTTTYTIQGSNGCGTVTTLQTITVTPIPVSVVAVPTLVCQGYQSTLTAVSSAPFYTWFPFNTGSSSVIATPTANSVYTVAVTDGTCVGTATVGVQTKTTPTISITPATSLVTVCEQASFQLTATGAGTGGTYSWTPGNTSGSSYIASLTTSTLVTVYGTNTLGCTATAQMPVQVLPLPTLVLSAVSNKTLICSGGSATLNATSNGTSTSWIGGPATNSYVISNASASNVYSATSTSSGGCQKTSTIAIAVIVPNVVHTTTAAICSGQSYTLTASGANTYTWNGLSTGSTGISVQSPLQTTTYTLIANTLSLTTNCPSTYTAQIVVNNVPTVSIASSKTTTICKGVTTTLTASGAQNYTWSTGATGSTLPVTPSITTTYSVLGTDANNCEGTQQYIVNVNKCAGIDEVNRAAGLAVYPNPNNGEFTIHSTVPAELKIVNSIGQVVKSASLGAASDYKVDVRDLSNGVYFLTGQADGEQVNIRIVVSR